MSSASNLEEAQAKLKEFEKMIEDAKIKAENDEADKVVLKQQLLESKEKQQKREIALAL